MTVARWQRWALLASLLAVAAWGLLWWPHSPLWALAGLGLPLAGFAVVLALEVVAMQRINRRDSAERASAWQCLAAWWAELCISPLLFGWRQPLYSRTLPDWLPQRAGGPLSQRRGVVLVHGFMCNRGLWLPWMRALRARGHAYVAVDLEPPRGSIDGYAPALEQAVQRVAQSTGRAPVVVCHSMGGLAVRAWLRARRAQAGAEGGGDHAQHGRTGIGVHRIITLGSPHGGTWLGRYSTALNARQMRLEGEWIRALRESEPADLGQWFTCWYSNCDNIVFPASTATLPGADNRFVAGLAHVAMVYDPAVLQACLESLDG